jgi:formate dehydrogenase iron-sulfur subunit
MSLVELLTAAKPETLEGEIGRHLAEQQRLTPVERFARLHERESDRHTQARYYRDLIPLSAPAKGEQYAFTVDLDACSGCKACVTACHSLNGLDECETFRDVGALVGRDRGGLHVLQHVTTACHHCLEPACLHGCPTLAYDKDPVTGIVRHLDDQCIGCQYCTLMCPYDVPKYNPAKGIVRKCDMCRQRLSEGEAPACVQACPNQAIRISTVRRDDIARQAASGVFLPTAPDPQLTLPTTQFVTSRTLRDVGPPQAELRPAHAHLPLVVMLVFTQMSIGLFALSPAASGPSAMLVAAVFGLIGLASAVFHLGRPQIAYRAWLGWRTSWMSREIIAFGLWSVLTAAYVAIALGQTSPRLQLALWALTALAGIATLGCSAMIYVATRRAVWSASRTVSRFVLTAVVLGIAGLAAIEAASGILIDSIWLGLIVAATLARLWCDASILRHRDECEELDRAAELLTRELAAWNHLQIALALVGGLFLPLWIIGVPGQSSVLMILSAALLVTAELIQRALFFAASSPTRMPGVIDR